MKEIFAPTGKYFRLFGENWLDFATHVSRYFFICGFMNIHKGKAYTHTHTHTHIIYCISCIPSESRLKKSNYFFKTNIFICRPNTKRSQFISCSVCLVMFEMQRRWIPLRKFCK
jgi:hypothetical protein